MKLMGLPNWMHWLCWFLDGTISAAVSVMVNKIEFNTFNKKPK
jgi:hypothetical protein